MCALVRQAMNDWSFGTAMQRMKAARQIVGVRDDILHVLAPLHIALPASFRTGYAHAWPGQRAGPGRLRAVEPGWRKVPASHRGYRTGLSEDLAGSLRVDRRIVDRLKGDQAVERPHQLAHVRVFDLCHGLEDARLERGSPLFRLPAQNRDAGFVVGDAVDVELTAPLFFATNGERIRTN